MWANIYNGGWVASRITLLMYWFLMRPQRKEKNGEKEINPWRIGGMDKMRCMHHSDCGVAEGGWHACSTLTLVSHAILQRWPTHPRSARANAAIPCTLSAGLIDLLVISYLSGNSLCIYATTCAEYNGTVRPRARTHTEHPAYVAV